MVRRFISVDPSTTFTGWAVFEVEALVAYGVIDTRALPFSQRFPTIIGDLSRRASQYGAQVVVIEDVKFAWAGVGRRNRNIAGLQAVFRSVEDWAKGMNYPFFAYNPATWKNAVLNGAHASKAVTKENICWRFPELPRNLTEHEYDAVGIGVYHGGILKMENLSPKL
jgi:Holliday junction resolvasome RuvABC endonuclease subunit